MTEGTGRWKAARQNNPPAPTLLFASNNDSGQRRGPVFVEAPCSFSAIVRQQTVAGGDSGAAKRRRAAC